MRYAIEPAYLSLLEKLGNPQKKLPPAIHVAGTNGKGSTCAFMRAILEAAGYRVHVYTSPHLVHFHERIRIAGELISEEELSEILGDCERLADKGQVSDFEAATAAMFVAFARHPADVCILEVGMGGRCDATNVIDKAAATIITRLSFDHCKYLGNSLTEIAHEKAGIMRSGVPCFAATQAEEALAGLRDEAAKKKAPLFIDGNDWRVEPDDKGFRFSDMQRTFNLPRPSLAGDHQLHNAGLAIAALSALPFSITEDAIARGLQKVEWPARLQKITQGALADLLPENWELWLDGGHNDSAGEVLAAQLAKWRQEDRSKPVYLICGMLSTKDAKAFLTPMAPYAEVLRAVEIPGEILSFEAGELAVHARDAGLRSVETEKDIHAALAALARSSSGPARVLICGSLYLAGYVLRLNSGQ